MDEEEVLGMLKVFLWVQLTHESGNGKQVTLLTKRHISQANALDALASFTAVNPDLHKLDVYSTWQSDPMGIPFTHDGTLNHYEATNRAQKIEAQLEVVRML